MRLNIETPPTGGLLNVSAAREEEEALWRQLFTRTAWWRRWSWGVGYQVGRRAWGERDWEPLEPDIDLMYSTGHCSEVEVRDWGSAQTTRQEREREGAEPPAGGRLKTCLHPPLCGSFSQRATPTGRVICSSFSFTVGVNYCLHGQYWRSGRSLEEKSSLQGHVWKVY